MAKMILDFYKNEDLYSDGDIEGEILKMVEEGKTLDDVDPASCPYPVLYHLSAERENIINWYPFKENASVLEIGAGPGAITGALCEKASKVVSVELSKRRATINYKRHENCENLEIYVGNLNDMTFEEKFDYVILNGVFEYAMSFTEGSDPYVSFLNNILPFLKDDGVLLIAIENRLGLKYFAGAPEDHTDSFFLGLNFYEGNNSVRTFSKYELVSLLFRAGLPFVQFYYPYPDYKFPTEIYSDETINSPGYGKDYHVLKEDRMLLFNEPKLAHTFAQEGVADVFANSFFVEASRMEIVHQLKVLYSKASSDRGDAFRIITSICDENGEKVVFKKNITEKSQKHIQIMRENEEKASGNGYYYLKSQPTDGGNKYKFLYSKTLLKIISDAIFSNDKDTIEGQLDKAFETILLKNAKTSSFKSREFEKVFGEISVKGNDLCLSPANIDLICENIFLEDDGYAIIDAEWIMNFSIPVKFIIWRNLEDLYNRRPHLDGLVSKKRLFSKYNISYEDEWEYKRWNKHFVQEYVGADRMSLFGRDKLQIHIDKLYREIMNRNSYECCLYLDYGQGFSEEGKLISRGKLIDNRFEIEYLLPDKGNIINYRFDPVELKACICNVEILDRFNNWKSIEAVNAKLKNEEGNVFISLDPMFSFSLSKTPKSIRLRGYLRYLNETEIINFCS